MLEQGLYEWKTGNQFAEPIINDVNAALDEFADQHLGDIDATYLSAYRQSLTVGVLKCT